VVTLVELSIVLVAVSLVAGALGSLLGLGGGFIVVPVLTLGFHLDIHLAIGTSIVAVAATSSAAAARNVAESITNLRVSTFLALGTTVGAVTGALLAGVFNARFLFGLFGAILIVSGAQMLRKQARKSGAPASGEGAGQPMTTEIREPVPATGELAVIGTVSGRFATAASGRLADRLLLHSAYYDQAEGREVPYVVTRTWLGLGLMYVAGMVSGLLGIGSGTLKVPSMDLAMNIPMKVSTATSNLLIGLTAAASAVVYFARGDVDPLIVGPVAIGILLGATFGSKMLRAVRSDRLRLLFVLVLGLVGVQMLWKGIG